MQSLIASVRVAFATLLLCVICYTAAVLGLARLISPQTAQGSLITRPDGTAVGSRLVAQQFTRPDYFWPRPSAADYDASAAGGSNKSPTSSDLAERASALIAQYGASAELLLPAELAAASGAGLDPHITEHAALYQAQRVAKARGIDQSQVDTMIEKQAFAPGGFLTPDRLVNVLELNLALDALSVE